MLFLPPSLPLFLSLQIPLEEMTRAKSQDQNPARKSNDRSSEQLFEWTHRNDTSWCQVTLSFPLHVSFTSLLSPPWEGKRGGERGERENSRGEKERGSYLQEPFLFYPSPWQRINVSLLPSSPLSSSFLLCLQMCNTPSSSPSRARIVHVP